MGIAGTTAMQVAVVSKVCSPISAVATSVDLVCSTGLLARGVFTASGHLDPHLITKGSIVVSSCVASLFCVALACIHPLLFPVALGIDVSGVTLACVVDAKVPGLCPNCRGCLKPVEDAEREVGMQKKKP